MGPTTCARLGSACLQRCSPMLLAERLCPAARGGKRVKGGEDDEEEAQDDEDEDHPLLGKPSVTARRQVGRNQCMAGRRSQPTHAQMC